MRTSDPFSSYMSKPHLAQQTGAQGMGCFWDAVAVKELELSYKNIGM